MAQIKLPQNDFIYRIQLGPPHFFVETSLGNRYLQKNGTCNHKWPFCAKISKTEWKNQDDQTGFHINAL